MQLSQADAHVEETAMDLSWVRPAFDALRAYELCAIHYERLDTCHTLGPNLAGNLASALKMPMRALAAAERIQTLLWQQFRVFFRQFDCLLTPCVAVAPFPVTEPYPATAGQRPMQTYYEWFSSTYVLSLTGLPVASVPCGLDACGLPVGLQVVGPPEGEEGVLALAQTIQTLCPTGLP